MVAMGAVGVADSDMAGSSLAGLDLGTWLLLQNEGSVYLQS